MSLRQASFFNQAGISPLSSSDPFGLSEEDELLSISPTVISWSSQSEPQFYDPTMTQVRNGQPTPPPFDEKKLQPEDLYLMTQKPFNSSSQFTHATRRSSISNQFQSRSVDGYSVGSRLRKSASQKNYQHDNEKRQRILHRNRLAASKCRQKKKEHSKQLEERFYKVSTRKTELESEIENLRSELITLKNELLLHASCNDEAIKIHLAQMVRLVTFCDAHHNDLEGSARSPTASASSLQLLSFGFDEPNMGSSTCALTEVDNELDELINV
ncbi:hypothetical protein ETB97_005219 [Aspergillus alliaceus]|uniref:BZIP domain-containing protein n=1 Tax=Petromyces alliaceus TaxID=209559 RepID=A0A8H5ZZE8_PETAA|nr:hypothetical protein ETB97_005219 [Aspergillus burnettii]